MSFFNFLFKSHQKLEHYIPEEFVDQITYKIKGKDSIKYIHPDMLLTMDMIREYFGLPVTINNWKWDNTVYSRKWSSLRTSQSIYYTKYSMHTFGRAIDFIVSGVSSKEVQKEILTHQDDKAFKFIKRIEKNTIGWTHIDNFEMNKNKIYVFRP